MVVLYLVGSVGRQAGHPDSGHAQFSHGHWLTGSWEPGKESWCVGLSKVFIFSKWFKGILLSGVSLHSVFVLDVAIRAVRER